MVPSVTEVEEKAVMRGNGILPLQLLMRLAWSIYIESWRVLNSQCRSTSTAG
jgi:hypothetical protein